MKNKPPKALAQILQALGIEQRVSFDDSQNLWAEFYEKTGSTPPPFEMSGNQWCALLNLALERHCPSNDQVQPCREAASAATRC